MADNSQHSEERLARFWRRKPLLLLAFGIVLAMTLFFGARTFVYFAGMHHQAQVDIRPWMRPAYIVRTFNVDEAKLHEALGIDIDSREHRLSLAQIARSRGVSKAELIMAVQAIIAERDGAGDAL